MKHCRTVLIFQTRHFIAICWKVDHVNYQIAHLSWKPNGLKKSSYSCGALDVVFSAVSLCSTQPEQPPNHQAGRGRFIYLFFQLRFDRKGQEVKQGFKDVKDGFNGNLT